MARRAFVAGALSLVAEPLVAEALLTHPDPEDAPDSQSGATPTKERSVWVRP